MNRRTIFVLLLLSATVIKSSWAAEPIQPSSPHKVDYISVIEQLEKTVQNELARGILTGVSIALVDGDRLVMAAGFGLADKDHRQPATANTVYRVGSISKLFTALAAMQLVEQGKLDLDAPINDVLKDFHIECPFDDAGPLTLRQMMCHRSGMVRESPVGGYLDGSQPTIAETIASLESCALVNPPNTKTRYSNVGPTIVGQAVSIVSDQAFEDYQQEHLLRPLGMRRSAWRANQLPSDQLSSSYMRVADGRGGFLHQVAPRFELGTLPAGNLYSSAGDLARFAQMLLAEGHAPKGRILQAETLGQMTKPQLIDEPTGFGLGFHVGTFADHRTIRHSGAVYGFSSSLVVIPEAGIAAIVLGNEDIAPGPVRRLSDAALSLMLEAKTGQGAKPAPAPIQLTSEQLRSFKGDYESESYWAEITLSEDRLLANISGQPMWLTAIEPMKFEADGRFVHRSAFKFRGDDSDCVIGFTALGQTFKRVDPERVRRIPAQWQKYLGSFGPEYIPLVISFRHGHLYAMTENMVDYRLTPVNQLVFRMPAGLYADEYLVFQIGRDGEVHSVNLANMTLKRRATGETGR